MTASLASAKWRRQAAGAAAAIVAICLAACGGGTSSGTAASGGTASGSGSTAQSSSGPAIAGGTLTIASATPPNSLNPALNGNGVPLMWFDTLAYEPLIFRQPDNTLQPGLATSWGYSDGNKVFTVNLRSDVKFSDGSPLTATVVSDWIKYYQAHGTFAFNLVKLASVTATGPLQVTFRLSAPDSLLPYYLDQEGSVGNIASAAAIANPSEMSTATYGAGPYTLDTAATIPNSEYVYVPNPHYFAPSAQHWKKIVIKVIGDANSTLSSMESGQVQVALGDATTANAAKSAGLSVSAERGGMVGVYLFDRLGKIVPALGNVKVRQALNYAINREGVTQTIYNGYGVATDQYKPASTDGYAASLASTYAYNVAKAKQLLAQAGYPNGFSFQMLVMPGIQGGTLLAQAVQQEWAAIGVKVSLVSPSTFADWVSLAVSKKYPATTYVYYYQPYIWEQNELFSPTGVYNSLGVSTPQINSLASQINSQPLGSAAANDLEQQAMSYAVGQALSVPISAIDTIVYSAKGISGIGYTSQFPIPDPAEWYATAS